MGLFSRKKVPYHSDLVDDTNTVGDDSGCFFSLINFLICLAGAVAWYAVISGILFGSWYWVEGGHFVRLFPEQRSSGFLYLLGFYTRCCFCVFSGVLMFACWYLGDSAKETVRNHALAFVLAVVAAAAIIYFPIRFGGG